MIGAIIGDVAGSTFEFTPCKTKNFPLFAPGSSFTDDTLMTIAVAQALTRANERGLGPCFAAFMRRMARRFPSPMGGYGGRFALVHRAERLTDVLCTLRASGIEPKRLRFLAKSADSAPSLLLVEGKRGGKSGLILEPTLIPGSAEWDRVYFRK